MGQICSYCRYICCCLTGNYKGVRKEVDDDFDSSIAETPDQLTKEYVIPSVQFKTDEDVFRYRGYDKKTMTQVGEGGFARVSKIIRIHDSNTLAVKEIFLKKTEDRSKTMLKRLKNEIQIISRINHKNIIRLEDHFIVNNTCYLFMELANAGTVDQEIDKGPLSEPTTQRYFFQIARAVDHLHGMNPPIAHNDLKLSNILIHCTNNERILKVSDFGLSIFIGQKKEKVYRAKTALGTLPYMSPEMMKLYLFNNMLSEREQLKMDKRLKPKTVNPIKADIWSLGVCLYRMVSAKYPFDVKENTSFLMNVVRDQFDRKRNPLEIEVSDLFKDLLDRMLEPITKRRIGIKDVIRHQWLSDVPEVISLDSKNVN